MIDESYWEDLRCFFWLVRHGADVRGINLFADFGCQLILRRNYLHSQNYASFDLQIRFLPDIPHDLRELYYRRDWKVLKGLDPHEELNDISF